MANNAVTVQPAGAREELSQFAQGAIRLAPKLLLVGILCYLSTEIGFANKVPPHNISALWPTNAILFAVLVVTPTRDWWAYAVAAYFTSVVIHDARAGFPLSAVLFLVAAFLEAFIAAAGVRRFAGGARAFDSLRTLVAYIIAAVVVAPFASSFVAAFAGGVETYWFYWRVWFLSEALAYVTLAPAILTWINVTRTGSTSVSFPRLMELSLLAFGLLAVCLGVFIWAPPIERSVPALVYLPLPFLLWAAVRFGPLGASTAILIVAVVSISSTVEGRGPFATSGPAENVLPLQLFLFAVSLPLMFLAALIAERREKTNVLSESEARFRSMADTAPVLIWISGQDRLCTFFNQRWLDFTGQTLEHELGNGWSEGVHPDDIERCLATYIEAFDARREFTMEYRRRRRDGEYRWVLDKGIPRLTPDGTFLGYIGCADDISDRKLAEERTRQVLEAAPNAMIVVTQEGKIVAANAAAERVFGYLREELIGRPVDMLIPAFGPYQPGNRNRHLSDLELPAMGVGQALFGRRKNGSEVPIEIGLTNIQTPEQQTVLVSIVDVTERMQAEAEMQRNRAELTHVARIATMGELTASLAHELSQPLATIVTNAEAAQSLLAAQPTELNEVQAIVNDIREVADHAGEVIHGLRALVRKEQPALAPIDLASVIREVGRLVHSDAVLRNCRISIEVDPAIPPVQGDKVQLQQVILNLLANAFDAMSDCPADERHVVVQAELKGAQLVRVSASDCGIGLGSDGFDKIFQPFYTTKREGLGMGLSISRAIIAGHGGRLWAENNPDRGATFYFTIPLGQAKEGDSKSPKLRCVPT